MARLGSKVTKRRGSQLEVRVRKDYHAPGEQPSHMIQLKFSTKNLKKYLNSATSSFIGMQLVSTGGNTLSVDRRDFFESDSSTKILKSLVQHLNVEEDIVNKIIAQVMRLGKRLNKKQDFQGLVVSMTFIKTFFGDPVSVKEALRELNRERQQQA